MIVEIMIKNSRSVAGVGIVAPSDNTCIWDVKRKKVAEPVNIICCRPSLLAVAIKAVNSHNTIIK